jgi:hypothetical protein
MGHGSRAPCAQAHRQADARYQRTSPGQIKGLQIFPNRIFCNCQISKSSLDSSALVKHDLGQTLIYSSTSQISGSFPYSPALVEHDLTRTLMYPSGGVNIQTMKPFATSRRHDHAQGNIGNPLCSQIGRPWEYVFHVHNL